MVYIAKKKVKGKIYLYLTKKARIKGKPRVVWQKYLGPEGNLDTIGKSIDAFKKKTEIEIKDYGLPMALMLYAEKLDYVNIINRFTNKRAQGLSVGDYMLIATLNRCIKPTSKNQLKKWFDSCYQNEKFPEINTYLNSNAYTNHFKYLTEDIIKNIETEFREKLISEFQLDMSNIFYDPTNYYTFINPKDQELPKHGNSKEGRFTLNLIGVSIFCTRDGAIPIMHKTYSENVMDASLFKSELPRMVEELNNLGKDVSQITIIYDKGNTSPEISEYIEKSGVKFICSARPSSFKDLHGLRAESFEIQNLPNGKQVGVKEFMRKKHDKPLRLIVSYNPLKKKWGGSVKMQKIQKTIAEVYEFFENRLNIKKWRDPSKVETKILSFFKKSDYLDYISYSIEGEPGALTIDIAIVMDKMDEHLQTFGKSYYLTNKSDIAPLDIVWLYRQQYTVENMFKLIKNPDMLQIRPMYHYLDSSIRGHVFSVVSGLLLISLLHRDVVKLFPGISIIKMMGILAEVKVFELKSGKNIQYRLTGTNESSEALIKFLKIDQIIKR